MELIDIYTELRDIKGKDYRKTILRRLTSDPARRQLLKLGGHDVDEKVSEETVLDILETVMLTPMFSPALTLTMPSVVFLAPK